MAASLAKGETIISNAAQEPEIINLGNCLNEMGAKISGLGTDEIKILGVNELFGTKFHHWYPEIHSFLAIVLTIITMIVLAWVIERLVLKHLVNQEPIILFMATIGLAFVLEGIGDLMWGSDVKVLDVGIPSGGSEWLQWKASNNFSALDNSSSGRILRFSAQRIGRVYS